MDKTKTKTVEIIFTFFLWFLARKWFTTPLDHNNHTCWQRDSKNRTDHYEMSAANLWVPRKQLRTCRTRQSGNRDRDACLSGPTYTMRNQQLSNLQFQPEVSRLRRTMVGRWYESIVQVTPAEHGYSFIPWEIFRIWPALVVLMSTFNFSPNLSVTVLRRKICVKWHILCNHPILIFSCIKYCSSIFCLEVTLYCINV